MKWKFRSLKQLFYFFFSFDIFLTNKPLFKNFHHQRVLICTKNVVSRLVLYFLIAAILKNFSGKRKNALSLVVQESVIISKEFPYTFFLYVSVTGRFQISFTFSGPIVLISDFPGMKNSCLTRQKGYDLLQTFVRVWVI